MPIRDKAAVELAHALGEILTNRGALHDIEVGFVASIIQNAVKIDENNADIERKQSVLKAIGG